MGLPLGFSRLVAIVTVATALGGASVVAVSSSATPGAALTLDRKLFRPELALSSAARSRGLMNRRRAPVDGMLFVFPRPTTGGFWMKNTLVPLTIVFFDADGERVRRLLMTPCRSDPCRIYSPGRAYRFALELRATDTRPARRLGPLRELRRLSRIAS
jgi:uncharacterized membrane protein (UPF0127 family)